uniref:Uncharacterized protein n=1 Tax=Molossus molossus TaxID=27622 RepID=A0A7J8DQ20_MOLMO|nr:hypothetical protein HJG59_009276 [Molossus molossus]
MSGDRKCKWGHRPEGHLWKKQLQNTQLPRTKQHSVDQSCRVLLMLITNEPMIVEGLAPHSGQGPELNTPCLSVHCPSSAPAPWLWFRPEGPGRAPRRWKEGRSKFTSCRSQVRCDTLGPISTL